MTPTKATITKTTVNKLIPPSSRILHFFLLISFFGQRNGRQHLNNNNESITQSASCSPSYADYINISFFFEKNLFKSLKEEEQEDKEEEEDQWGKKVQEEEEMQEEEKNHFTFNGFHHLRSIAYQVF